MKYDKVHIDPLLQALKEGKGRVRACKIANVDYQTFLNWIESKVEFLESVKKAEKVGNDKIKDMCKRRIFTNKNWQASAWWLERNYPDEYKQRTEQTGNDNKFEVTRTIIEKS